MIATQFQRLYLFLRSSKITALVQILSYVKVSGISKMAACNQKWIYTPNLPQTLMSKSIQISPVMILDPKNIGVAVGISLYLAYKLSYMLFHIHFRLQAVILVLGLYLSLRTFWKSLALWVQSLPLSLAFVLSLLITRTHNWPYNRECAHDTCYCCWEFYLVELLVKNWKSRKTASRNIDIIFF